MRFLSICSTYRPWDGMLPFGSPRSGRWSYLCAIHAGSRLFPGRPASKRTGSLKYALDSIGVVCMVTGRGTHTVAVARQSRRTTRTKQSPGIRLPDQGLSYAS